MSPFLTRGSFAVATLALVGAIGLIDSVTGVEVRVFPLYFLPLSLAAWHGGRWAAGVACLLCTAAWVSSNVLAGVSYQHPATPYVNSLALLVAFATVAALIVLLHERLVYERELARRDMLTGLWNSRAFHDLAALEIERTRRYARPFTIAYLDVDDFKLVNDRIGHLAGDELLTRVGRALEAGLRTNDVVARLGGDEFAVLLPECGLDAGHAALTKLQERLRALAREAGWPVAFSIGAVSFEAAPGDVHAALQRADALMYEVKRGSKDGFRIERVAT